MKKHISTKLQKTSEFLELIIGIGVLLLCIICGLGMFLPIDALKQFGNTDFFLAQLSDASYLIIGIEFIKLISSHQMETILDIIALTLSREMIIHNTTPVENLLCVFSVAIIFIIRKYLSKSKDSTTSPKKETEKAKESV